MGLIEIPELEKLLQALSALFFYREKRQYIHLLFQNKSKTRHSRPSLILNPH